METEGASFGALQFVRERKDDKEWSRPRDGVRVESGGLGEDFWREFIKSIVFERTEMR